MEKILLTIMNSSISKYNILTPFQFGFRKNHSTGTAVSLFISSSYKEIDEGKKTMGILLDLSKAFDSICHSTLISKLKHYGFRGNIFKWFETYLKDRPVMTFVNNSQSDIILQNHGVPQGTIISPLLS